MNVTTKPLTLGMIVGNRGFFPAHLCDSGRKTMLKVLAEEGIDVIALTPEESRYGSIESIEEARRCADLFRTHRDEIDGVLITLPNFGDERAIANAMRWSELNVPVLIHAFPDDEKNMTIKDRRDSFCGKMSHCNNLKQYGIKYTLTASHTVDPESAAFRADLARFGAICRVVRGLKFARIGAIGARPGAFNTVRFSEKLLEKSGITVETLDLSEIFGRIDRLADNDASVTAKLEQIENYIQTKGIPAKSLLKMAKLGAVVDGWMLEMNLQASAVQCWTSLEENFGVVPCTVMSIMSNGLMPAACETDIAGTVAMMALAYASGKPSAIVDWNNNYGDDPDKAVLFHCSNLPKDVFVDQPGNFFKADDIPVMDYQEIIAGTVGRDNTYGTINGRVKDDAFTYLRVSTDDVSGRIVAYVGEGKMTNDPLKTFGGYGVAEVPELQKLLHFICENGFEHHVSMNLSQTASAVHEALEKYLGWPTYFHGRGGKAAGGNDSIVEATKAMARLREDHDAPQPLLTNEHDSSKFIGVPNCSISVHPFVRTCSIGAGQLPRLKADMGELQDELPPRRATIRDVAAEANVSIATVSLFLQGGKGVAGDTGERIAAAIKKLDYVPRPRTANGRATTGRKGNFIALLMEELSFMAFPEAIYGAVIRAIELEARRHKMGLLLATVEENRIPQSVRDNQVEGVIILGGSPTNDALAVGLAACKVPLVLVDTYNANLPVDSIVPDNEWGGYNAFKHLVELGHRQIAIIEGPPKYKTLTDRRWGALRAAEELGVPIPPFYRHPSISSGYPKKGYREMKQLLALPQPPTAVFAVSDRAALGAIDAIKERGLRVPEDISIVGFDDLANAEYAVPPLTTVHYAREEMGAFALQSLLNRITIKAQAPTRTCVLTELVVRASTAPCVG